MENEELEVCEICNEETKYLTDINGELVCDDCLTDGYFFCNNCQEYHSNSEDYVNLNECVYCASCTRENLTICSDCGGYYPNDDTCYSDINDRAYCEDCYSERFSTCNNCGESMYNENANHTDGGCFCDSCVPADYDSIQEYSYKPESIFHKAKNEKCLDYYGIELEIEADRDTWADTIARFSDNGNLCYAKIDGSLNDGYEIVSHPMSLKFHKTEMKWESILRALKETGAKSFFTTTCGIHIHVSRAALSQIEQIKLGMFIFLNQAKMELIAQRAESDWARYPKKSLKNMGTNYDERYEALNFYNRNTIEIRVFKGTLKYSTFMSYLEFFHSAVNFVKSVSCSQLADNKKAWPLYQTYIKNNKKTYGYLTNYLITKNLL